MTTENALNNTGHGKMQNRQGIKIDDVQVRAKGLQCDDIIPSSYLGL
jgi:hypothetical protein